MGVERDPRLELLHHEIEESCAQLRSGGRAFRPRITLGRVRHRLDPVARALATAARSVSAAGSMMARTVDLMSSEYARARRAIGCSPPRRSGELTWAVARCSGSGDRRCWRPPGHSGVAGRHLPADTRRHVLRWIAGTGVQARVPIRPRRFSGNRSPPRARRRRDGIKLAARSGCVSLPSRGPWRDTSSRSCRMSCRRRRGRWKPPRR